jgi:hypothetical protein
VTGVQTCALPIYHLLQNPVYIGEIRHREQRFPGLHEAIVDRETWDAVQAKLADNAARAKRRETAAAPSPLAGKFTDETGDKLTPSHAVRRGRRHRYYVSHRLIARSGETDLSGWRLPAATLETAVAALIRNTLADPAAPARLLVAPTPAEVATVRDAAGHLVKQIDGPSCVKLLATLVNHGRIAPGRLSIKLDQQALAKRLRVQEQRIDPAALTIECDFTLRRRGVEAKLVLDQAAREIDRTLSRNLSLGWSWLNEIKRGASMEEIASRNGISQRAIARLIDLAFLAPDIVDAIVTGRQPVNLTANVLIRAKHQRLWHDQRAMIAAL